MLTRAARSLMSTGRAQAAIVYIRRLQYNFRNPNIKSFHLFVNPILVQMARVTRSMTARPALDTTDLVDLHNEGEYTDMNKFLLHTYFPGCSLKPEVEDNTRASADLFINREHGTLLKQKIIYYLITKKCNELLNLGSRYYSDAHFHNHQELFASFSEISKKLQVYFLAEEIARDKLLLGKYDTSHDFYQCIHAYLDPLLSDKPSLGNPSDLNALKGICKRGFAKTAEGRVCHPVHGYVASKPLLMNKDHETKVLTSLLHALHDTIELNIKRKMFEANLENFEEKSCTDSTGATHAGRLSTLGKDLRSAVSATARSTASFGRVVLSGAKRGVSKTLSATLSPHVVHKLQTTGKKILTFTDHFNTQVLKSVNLRAAFKGIKRSLLETVCDYILEENILERLQVPTEQQKCTNNHKNVFSLVIKSLYTGTPDKALASERLFELFLQRLSKYESLYVNAFNTSVTAAINALDEVSFGLTEFMFNSATRFSNEVVVEALKSVFSSFFNMKLIYGDIIEYVVHVFDVSEELYKRPLVLQQHPQLNEWRSLIGQQVLGAPEKIRNEIVIRGKQESTLNELKATTIALARLFDMQRDQKPVFFKEAIVFEEADTDAITTS